MKQRYKILHFKFVQLNGLDSNVLQRIFKRLIRQRITSILGLLDKIIKRKGISLC